MEDVLDLYAEPCDPARPVVCFDATSKQLSAETQIPLPMEPGKPERIDYEHACQMRDLVQDQAAFSGMTR